MNIVKIKKFTTLASLLFTWASCLMSYPCYYTRLYNEQTDQTIDIIGDCLCENDSRIHAKTCNRLSTSLGMLDQSKTTLIWETADSRNYQRNNLRIYLASVLNLFIEKYAIEHLNNKNFIAADFRPLNNMLISGYLNEILNSFKEEPNFNRVLQTFSQIIEPLIDQVKESNPTTSESDYESVSFDYLKDETLDRFFSIDQIPPNSRKIFSEQFQAYKQNVESFFNEFDLNQPNLKGFINILQHLLRRLKTGDCIKNFLEKSDQVGSPLLDLQLLKNIFIQTNQHLIVYSGYHHVSYVKEILINNKDLGFKIVFEINHTANLIPINPDDWQMLLVDAKEQLEHSLQKSLEWQHILIKDEDDEELLLIESQKSNLSSRITKNPSCRLTCVFHD